MVIGQNNLISIIIYLDKTKYYILVRIYYFVLFDFPRKVPLGRSLERLSDIILTVP